jgi:hypothetical protein
MRMQLNGLIAPDGKSKSRKNSPKRRGQPNTTEEKILLKLARASHTGITLFALAIERSVICGCRIPSAFEGCGVLAKYTVAPGGA